MGQNKNSGFKPAHLQLQSATGMSSTSEIKAQPMLGYKLRVLLHDLRNIAKDLQAEQRTLNSTDELYLGPPYLTSEESVLVKAALVSESVVLKDPEETEISPDQIPTKASVTQMTVEEAIHTQLQNFFAKRRASGDSRPCGPHDLAPVYLRVFGVTAAELEDEKFLSRLRKVGLNEPASSQGCQKSLEKSNGKVQSKKQKGKEGDKAKGNARGKS